MVSQAVPLGSEQIGVLRPQRWQNGAMRFRTGLVIGLGVGYILGARAGRERYDQIVAWWERMGGDEAVASVATKVADVTADARNGAREAIGDGLRSAGSAVRSRTDRR
jgi:hypothetical protein